MQSLPGRKIPRTFVIRPHASGFFSNYLKVISILQAIGPGEAVIVDWTLPSPIGHFPYGTASDGNIWERLFEPLPFVTFPEFREVITSYPSEGVPAGLDAYRMYLNDHGWRERLGGIADRYIRPRREILERAAAVLNRQPGEFIVGVHYRHPGHDIEAPYPIPSPGEFIRQVRRAVRGKATWRVYLATDDERAAQKFRKAFGGRLIEQALLSRSAGKEQIHETRAQGDIELAREVLVDALALAHTDMFLHIVSNVATAVGLLNPQLRMAYCRSPFDEVVQAKRRLRWWAGSLKRSMLGNRP